MKEDYLWNKTGDDPEIRRLEETLAVFRHEADAAPLLPVPVMPAKAIKRSWTPWLRFAIAAPAVVVLAAAVWLLTAQETQRLETRAIEIETGLRPGQQRAETEQRNGSPVETADLKATSNRALDRPLRSRIAPVYRTRQVRSQKTAVRPAPPALTSEERYAYEKLMLALSITGSKLKIVRDTIDGTEDTDRSDKR